MLYKLLIFGVNNYINIIKIMLQIISKKNFYE